MQLFRSCFILTYINIFVSDDDPSVITGIIDWQSSSIEPAFWYADEVPGLATYSSSSESSSQSVDDGDLYTKTYEICTQFLTTKLARPRLVNECLFRPFRYCYRTWKDGAVAFRHELIDTSKDWEVSAFPALVRFPCRSQKRWISTRRNTDVLKRPRT